MSLGIYRKEKINDLINEILMGNQRDCHYAHYKGLTVGLCIKSYNMMAIMYTYNSHGELQSDGHNRALMTIMYTQCHIILMGSYNLMAIIEH